MGTIKDYLHGGSYDDLDGADTIASEIRSALAEVRKEAGITQPLPSGDNAQQMNILFAAIGRGLLNHLTKHPHAFQVNVNQGVFSADGYATEIDVKGP
jgi:hypothetical protein